MAFTRTISGVFARERFSTFPADLPRSRKCNAIIYTQHFFKPALPTILPHGFRACVSHAINLKDTSYKRPYKHEITCFLTRFPQLIVFLLDFQNLSTKDYRVFYTQPFNLISLLSFLSSYSNIISIIIKDNVTIIYLILFVVIEYFYTCIKIFVINLHNTRLIKKLVYNFK